MAPTNYKSCTNAQISDEKVIHKELSYKIVGILYDVYNDLGYGYQEKIYERALVKYFTDNKIKFKRQVPYKIIIKDKVIGKYFLDFLVEDKIIVELKKGNYFSRKNIDQIKGYLKVTGLNLAIIANFTPAGVKFFRVLKPQI